MDERLKFGLDVARRAGAVLRDGYERTHQISGKAGRELVTETDFRSENLIKQAITKRFPEDGIVAEESDTAWSELTWVIDPLDGTNNFAHNFPFFCVSIALVKDTKPLFGVVYEPLRDELFWCDGKRSFLGEREIKVAIRNDLSDTLLATGFPYDLARGNENNLDLFEEFSYRSRGMRRAGSAALDLVYVAAGRLDGFWELKLKPWDIAAGAAIVRCAGGNALDFTGKDWTTDSDRVVAANSSLAKEMVRIIKEVHR